MRRRSEKRFFSLRTFFMTMMIRFFPSMQFTGGDGSLMKRWVKILSSSQFSFFFQHENVCVHYTHVNQVKHAMQKNIQAWTIQLWNKLPHMKLNYEDKILKTPSDKKISRSRLNPITWEFYSTKELKLHHKKLYLCAFKDCNFKTNRFFFFLFHMHSMKVKNTLKRRVCIKEGVQKSTVRHTTF